MYIDPAIQRGIAKSTLLEISLQISLMKRAVALFAQFCHEMAVTATSLCNITPFLPCCPH